MLIAEILRKAHRKVFRDTDYPESGSEDLAVLIDHADDAVSEWEDCAADEGIMWPELAVSGRSLEFGGTGTDPLFDDFLCFMKTKEDEEIRPAEIVSGSARWIEVSAGEGSRAASEGLSPHFFWKEGSSIRTLPAISGSVIVPYLRKARRFESGSEEYEPDMRNHKFIEDYVAAKSALDNSDDTLYQSFANSASEKLEAMKIGALT